MNIVGDSSGSQFSSVGGRGVEAPNHVGATIAAEEEVEPDLLLFSKSDMDFPQEEKDFGQTGGRGKMIVLSCVFLNHQATTLLIRTRSVHSNPIFFSPTMAKVSQNRSSLQTRLADLFVTREV